MNEDLINRLRMYAEDIHSAAPTSGVSRVLSQAADALSERNAVECKTHPDAPHGFDRNASHSADRYVCECESWEPPKREWVGLHPDLLAEISDPSFRRGAKWAEELLKEENA